jgi:hypothetical protein
MEAAGIVDSEGGRSDNSIDAERFDNVIRLPREWIGPLEELVPIGPRARNPARDRLPHTAGDRLPNTTGDRLPHPAARVTSVPEPTEPTVGVGRTGDHAGVGAAGRLTADAFWGADSRELHQAVQPTPESVGPPAAAVSAYPTPASRAPARAGHLQRALMALSLAAVVAAGVLLARTLSGAAGDHKLQPSAHRPGVTSTLLAASGGASAGSEAHRALQHRHESSSRELVRAARRRRRLRPASVHPSRQTTGKDASSADELVATPTAPANESAAASVVNEPSTMSSAGMGSTAGGSLTAAVKTTSTTTSGRTTTVGSARSVGASSGAGLSAGGLPAPGGPPPP